MAIRDLEKIIYEELKKVGAKIPGSAEKWEYHPAIQRIAKAAYQYAEGRKAHEAVFRDIATKWYRDQKREGFFRNDFQEDRRKEHSFWSFAWHLDKEWSIGVARKSPWKRAVQWFRKVRYKIKRSISK